MAMPSGDSPEEVAAVLPLPAGPPVETDTAQSQTWHVDWLSLAWLWGFVIVLSSCCSSGWIRQYRTTRAAARASSPWTRLGGYTTEARRARVPFFFLFTAVVVVFAIVLIVGHLVYGQMF